MQKEVLIYEPVLPDEWTARRRTSIFWKTSETSLCASPGSFEKNVKRLLMNFSVDPLCDGESMLLAYTVLNNVLHLHKLIVYCPLWKGCFEFILPHFIPKRMQEDSSAEQFSVGIVLK